MSDLDVWHAGGRGPQFTCRVCGFESKPFESAEAAILHAKWHEATHRPGPEAWQAAAAEVRGRYPEDIFPAEGTSLDAASARFARTICDEIVRLATVPVSSPSAARPSGDGTEGDGSDG